MNKKQLLASIFLAFGFINMVYAEPSEQETIDFIKQKISACGNFNTTNTWYNSNNTMRIKNTKITIKENNLKIMYNTVYDLSYVYNDGSTIILTETITALLSDLEKSDYYYNKEPKKDRVEIICSEDDQGGRVPCISYTSRCKYKYDKVHKYNVCRPESRGRSESKVKDLEYTKKSFYVCNNKDAKKISKALNHLIKLHKNSGKKELF